MAATVECPYCESRISATASRCRYCGGEVAYCPRCDATVGVRVVEKWVGILRGGRQTQVRCIECRKVLDGPRW